MFRMAASIDNTHETLEEMMLVLDSSQITIYLDVNSDKNLPILKKYLTSATVPIMGISGVMGKPKQEVSLDNSTSIEDQCHMLLKIVFDNIQYIQYQPKNEQCQQIIDKVSKQNVLQKLKLYFEKSEVYGYFQDKDLNKFTGKLSLSQE